MPVVGRAKVPSCHVGTTKSAVRLHVTVLPFWRGRLPLSILVSPHLSGDLGQQSPFART